MDKKEIEALKKIQSHSEDLINQCRNINSVDEFEKNVIINKACDLDLILIGEIAHICLTDQTKKELERIPWSEIYGLRNRIVHGYDDIKQNIIFDTIKNDIPDLLVEVTEALKKL